MNRKLKRRDFLKVSSVAVLGAVAAACGAQPTAAPTKPPAAEPTKPPAAAAGKEAPMLAEMVKAGKLPAVEKRLPDQPLVVTDREKIGVYGGELRLSMMDPVWWVSAYDILVERFLVYSDKDGRTIVPNVLAGWEVTPDGKTYTFKLRKGMKWHTGDPITTEDVRFWWEDHMTNKEINSSPWWQFRFGGQNMKVEIVDEVTFKFTFARAFGNFPAHLTRWDPGADCIVFPSKYLKQFHPKYTDKAKLEADAKAEKLESWVQWYNNHIAPGKWGGPKFTIEYPKIFAWYLKANPAQGLFQWERNPYYWKVDAQGQQLPYVDTLRFDYVAASENHKVKLAQGEIDIMGQHIVTMADYPFYKENAAKGNYIVGDYISSMGDRVTLFPQHTLTEDPGLTEIVRDYRWVQALSMAINREEINQTLFYGTAKMGAMSPMPSSKYYKPEYGTAWAKYDKAAAEKLLDDMGLKKGAGGMRTRKDGSPLKYNIENCGIRVGPVVPKFCEMIVSYWREIGVDATTKEIQESLYNERMQNGLVHVGVWHADRCSDMLFHIEPQWFIPTSNGSQGGPDAKWGQWYLAPDRTKPGLVEPPADIKKLLETFDKMTEVVDENERVKLGQEIFDYLAKNPLEIGTVLECPAPLCFNKNLRNLPKPKAYIGWDSYGLSTYHPEAFFYEGGKRA
ncbi:MAG TPA: ABC transporter substrate-binding protein [Anaerolineaceae bacterium]